MTHGCVQDPDAVPCGGQVAVHLFCKAPGAGGSEGFQGTQPSAKYETWPTN